MLKWKKTPKSIDSQYISLFKNAIRFVLLGNDEKGYKLYCNGKLLKADLRTPGHAEEWLDYALENEWASYQTETYCK